MASAQDADPLNAEDGKEMENVDNAVVELASNTSTNTGSAREDEVNAAEPSPRRTTRTSADANTSVGPFGVGTGEPVVELELVVDGVRVDVPVDVTVSAEVPVPAGVPDGDPVVEGVLEGVPDPEGVPVPV